MNTDIDIESSCCSLDRLKEFLDERACLLFGEQLEDGSWILRFEAEGSGIIGFNDHTPNADFAKLTALLKEAKQLFPDEFSGFDKFDFNIGWQSSKCRPEGSFTVENDLISAVAGLGATISVTIYPSEEEDEIAEHHAGGDCV